MTMILAADVGGTKTVIGLFEKAGGRLRVVRDDTFPSQRYDSLNAILNRFLNAESRASLLAACFGVAGPIIEGRSRTTNLPWELDERALADALQIPRVKLLNDLEATAYGVLHLEPSDLCTLQPGHPRKGNIAVISAGTGLGQAILYWDGARYHSLATEGGHADFAPRNNLEIELLRYLQRTFDHVSYERLLSGPGLFNIYRFLRERADVSEPEWLRTRIAEEDPGTVISEVGLAEDDPFCRQALDLFVSVYGAEAGNLALKVFAIGGVYLGGGIAPHIFVGARGRIPLRRTFLRAFTDKGRFAELLQSIEVTVVLNPHAPLFGAAYYALRLAQDSASPHLITPRRDDR